VPPITFIAVHKRNEIDLAANRMRIPSGAGPVLFIDDPGNDFEEIVSRFTALMGPQSPPVVMHLYRVDQPLLPSRIIGIPVIWQAPAP
jgi:hypothetical protein